MQLASIMATARAELASITSQARCCQRAEVCTALRLTASFDPSGNQPAVTAILSSYNAAAWLRTAIQAAFGYQAALREQQPDPDPGLRDHRYLVTVTGPAAARLARQGGLLDIIGRPVRGLAREVVAGRRCDCAAAWRAAFLVAGSVSVARRSVVLRVWCPAGETALALAGLAHRIGAPLAKPCVTRDSDQVMVRGISEVCGLLSRIGAADAAQAFEEAWTAALLTGRSGRRRISGSLKEANGERTAAAAAAAAEQARRALEILGDAAPPHLRAAGELRIKHRMLTLTDLGQAATPPLSKHTIAGRLRTLTRVGAQAAAEQGIPGPVAPAAARSA